MGKHPLARLLRPPAEVLLKLGGSRDVSIADTYHGKAVPLEAATRLVTVNEELRLTNLEQVIPYALARDIILQQPEHIAVIDCPCRSARENPCLPLDRVPDRG